jgi:small GTP-binding protein
MYSATFKIVLFGDAGVGKKTLAHNFLDSIYDDEGAITIGVDFYTKSVVVDDNKAKLQVSLLRDEERFRFLLPSFVRGASGGFFMYDITNYSSIAHIDEWLTLIRKEIRAEDSFPIIVAGNKADLDEIREVSSEDGINIAKSRGVDGFIECSCKTGNNIEKMFQALALLIISEEHI